LELEGAPHSITVTPDAAYNAYAAGSINELAKGEILKDSGPGTTISLLVADHASGLYKAEIVDALTELEAISGIGTGTVKSISYPYGERTAAARLAAISAGLTTGRVTNIDTGSYQHIANLDKYNIGVFNPVDVVANTTSGDQTEDIKANISGLMAYLAETGSVADIYCHKDSELSLAQWITILDEIYKWRAKVTHTMSLTEAITDILTYATDDGDGTISYTWTDQGNQGLTAGSPARGAGTIIPGIHTTPWTDMSGQTWQPVGTGSMTLQQ
jgi:hypothetical protein